MLLGTFQNPRRPRVTLQNQKNLKVKCLIGATSSYKVKYTWFFTVQEKRDPDDVNLQDFIPSEMVVNRRKGRKCVG